MNNIVRIGFASFIIGFLLGWAGFAGASPENCMKGAKFVESVSILRDQGIPVTEVVQSVNTNFAEDEKEFFTMLVNVVYSHPEMSPGHLAQDFYITCRKYTDVNVN